MHVLPHSSPVVWLLLLFFFFLTQQLFSVAFHACTGIVRVHQSANRLVPCSNMCLTRVSLLHNNNKTTTHRHHPSNWPSAEHHHHLLKLSVCSGPSGMVRCWTACTRTGFMLCLWIRLWSSNEHTGGRPREGTGPDWRRHLMSSTLQECCSAATVSMD